jgi:hypothetical protein
MDPHSGKLYRKHDDSSLEEILYDQKELLQAKLKEVSQANESKSFTNMQDNADDQELRNRLIEITGDELEKLQLHPEGDRPRELALLRYLKERIHPECR